MYSTVLPIQFPFNSCFLMWKCYFLREGSIQETYSKPYIFPKKVLWPPVWNLWNFEHMGFHFLTLNLSRIGRKKSHMPKSTVLYCFMTFSDLHILPIFFYFSAKLSMFASANTERDQNFCILESFAVSHWMARLFLPTDFSKPNFQSLHY